MADDLTPADGISDYWIEFAGMDAVPGNGGAYFRFNVSEHPVGAQDQPRGTLTFFEAAQNDGLDGMLLRAHDSLVNALRRMLYVADKQRGAYRAKASP